MGNPQWKKNLNGHHRTKMEDFPAGSTFDLPEGLLFQLWEFESAEFGKLLPSGKLT